MKLDATDGDDDGGWTRQFGSASVDYVLGIAVDGTGVYVAGYTSGALPGQTSSGCTDAFVVKLDAVDGEDDGGWTRQFGSSATTTLRGRGGQHGGLRRRLHLWHPPRPTSSAAPRVVKLDAVDGETTASWIRQFGSAASTTPTGLR